MKVLLFFLVNVVLVYSRPTGSSHFEAEGGFTNGAIPPFISFDKGGNVGVNFGGYHASAGLGGLLTGDWARGGLHASAGTPTGQAAAAGLGGSFSGRSGASGGLYAGATSGVYKSSAGLYGVSNNAPVNLDGSAGYKGVAKGVVVAETAVHGPAEVQKTIIEKTVIPNYVEKKVQETQFVEKTVKVPTIVEKTVRVPVAPTVIEKHIEVPAQKHHQANAEAGLDVRMNVVEKQGPASVGVVKYGSVGSSYDSGAAGEFYAGGGVSSGGYAKGQLFTDIFNIPISTLGAVRNLLNGIAGGGAHAGGGFYVNKQYSTY